MKLLVDVPDDVVLTALETADVSEEELAIDGTATDAVVEDALRAFVAIDGAAEVLDERPDLPDARTTGEHLPDGEQWRNITGEEVSSR